MQNKKHIIIFSHGFGTKKDDRGLLSGEYGISEELNKLGIETILFDYNVIDEMNNTITVSPLRKQIKKLEKVIQDTKDKYPEKIIDIIAHSQGCIVPAVLLTKGINKIILLSPSLDVNNERMINLFKKDPNTVINLNGVSRLGRKDGTTTIVPSEYWIDRGNTEPIPLYNKLAQISDVTMIRARQDDILGNLNISGLSNNITDIELDGDHSFNGVERNGLIEKVKEILKV
jgi:hypothetical protein